MIVPPPEQLDQLAELLNNSRHITMVCGSGCAAAHQQIIMLAEMLKSLVVHALRGKEYLQYDNPYDVGMTGIIGFAFDYHAMKNGDTLLLLGTQFPYRAFYPEKAKII